MSSIRNVLMDPVTTHIAMGIAGAVVIAAGYSLRQSVRERRGRARAVEIGVPLPANVLGALSDEEFALLKGLVDRPALGRAGA